MGFAKKDEDAKYGIAAPVEKKDQRFAKTGAADMSEPQPAVDLAVYLKYTEAQDLTPDNVVVLNTSCTGKFEIRQSTPQTTLTLSLQKKVGKHLDTSSLILNHTNFSGFVSIEDIPIAVIRTLKPNLAMRLGLPDDKLHCFRAQLKFTLPAASECLFLNPPEFAEAFSQAVLTDKSVTILIIGASSTKENIDQMVAEVINQQATNPYAAWHTSNVVNESKMTWQAGQTKEIGDTPKSEEFKYAESLSFNDPVQYMTTTGYACIFADEEAGSQKTRYEAAPKTIRLVELATADNEFLGFLPVPADEDTRFSAGDTLKLNFDVEDEDINKSWPARVTEGMPGAPPALVTVIVKRPWSKQKAKWMDDVPEKVMKLADLKGGFAALFKHEGISCKVKLTRSSAERKRVLNMFDGWTHKPNTFWVGLWQDTFEEVVLARDLHNLPTKDIFAPVRAVEPDYLDTLKLNTSQKDCERKAEHSLGGLQMIQGGPGTGKSHFIIENAGKYAEHGLQALLISPHNAGVDDLAEKAHAKILSLQARGLAENAFVLRVHSKASEKKLVMQEANLERGRPEDARPLSQKDMSKEDRALLEDIELAQLVDRQHQKEVQPREGLPLVPDKRVKMVELALATRMLQWIDIIKTGPKAPNPKKWRQAVTLYERYSGSSDIEIFSNDEMAKLVSWFNKLRAEVIKNAAIVCCTVSNAGEFIIQRNVVDTVRIIIGDEMALVPEHVLLPVLFGQYKNLGGVIFIGDPNQGKPLTTSSKESNPFYQRLESSLMTRLMKCGFPIEFFVTQYRMHPNISHIVNDVCYDNRLEDAPCTKDLADDDLVYQIMEFNKAKYKRGSNVVFIDIQKPKDDDQVSANVTKTFGTSRYNEYHVAEGANLVWELLERFPNITIGFIAPYAAQKRLKLSAKNRMVATDKDGKLAVDDRLFVGTVDEAQGKEFTIVVTGYTIVENQLGFQDSINRNCVWHSRAKKGVYIISSKIELDADQHKKWTPDFLTHWLKYRVKLEVQPTIPQSRFFVSGQIDMETLEEKTGITAPAPAPVNEAVDNNLAGWGTDATAVTEVPAWNPDEFADGVGDKSEETNNEWGTDQGGNAGAPEVSPWNLNQYPNEFEDKPQEGNDENASQTGQSPALEPEREESPAREPEREESPALESEREVVSPPEPERVQTPSPSDEVVSTEATDVPQPSESRQPTHDLEGNLLDSDPEDHEGDEEHERRMDAFDAQRDRLVDASNDPDSIESEDFAGFGNEQSPETSLWANPDRKVAGPDSVLMGGSRLAADDAEIQYQRIIGDITSSTEQEGRELINHYRSVAKLTTDSDDKVNALSRCLQLGEMYEDEGMLVVDQNLVDEMKGRLEAQVLKHFDYHIRAAEKLGTSTAYHASLSRVLDLVEQHHGQTKHDECKTKIASLGLPEASTK